MLCMSVLGDPIFLEIALVDEKFVAFGVTQHTHTQHFHPSDDLLLRELTYFKDENVVFTMVLSCGCVN